MPPKNEAPPEEPTPELEEEGEGSSDGASEPNWQEERASLLADIRRESKAAFEELLSELDGEAILDGGDDAPERESRPSRPSAAGRGSGNGRGRGAGAAIAPPAEAASYLGFLFGQRKPRR